MTAEQDKDQDRSHDDAEGGGAHMRVRGQALVDKVKELIHQGNVRRIVIKNDQGHPVIEVPVNAGVVAVVAAPVVTAIGAIAALAKEWSIDIEHREPPEEEPERTIIDEPT